MSRSHPEDPPPPADEAPRFLSRGYQGAVYVIGSGAARRIVKRPIGNRLTRPLRRAMLRHEYAVYRRLSGIRGVPGCHGLGENGELQLEFIDAKPWDDSLHDGAQREQFFASLLALIQALHQAGVSHSDLKRRGNILIDAQGRPWLIDFGTALLHRPQGGFLHRLLFRHACRIDLNAWVKLKYRRRFDAISAEDRRYYRPSRLENGARAVRRLLRSLTARRWRKRRQRRRREGG